MSTPIEVVRDRVLHAALRIVDNDLEETPHSTSAADAEYAAEQLALAARELVDATEALPAAEQPEGWTAARRSGREAEAHRRLREMLGPVTPGEVRTSVVDAALRRLVIKYSDGDALYADDQLAIACKALVRFIDQSPSGQRPVGWDRAEGSQ